MKGHIMALLAVAFAILVGAGMAFGYTGTYVPGAGINETPHDLGHAHNGMNYVAIPADPLQRICIFCHAPHNSYKLSPANGGPPVGVGGGITAPDAFDYLPLWNHEFTANVAGYTMYQNGPGAPTIGPKASQAIQNGMTDPGGVSLLCLSCHDGSVAVNSYGNVWQPPSSQSGGGPTIFQGYQIGRDLYLGNHHPIGFDYDAVVAVDTEIRDPDLTQFTVTTSVRDHLFGNANNQLECASCHSVHNKGNTGEMLLWRSDQNSELCLTCHDKGNYTAP